MLISESISSFPRRPQMILINAMSCKFEKERSVISLNQKCQIALIIEFLKLICYIILCRAVILFSLCCFCLCHSAISSTIQVWHFFCHLSSLSTIIFMWFPQEDIDKFLRNDLLLYISKDGIESADRTNLAGHHQLDQFQDFSVLRQPFSSSSLVYDDNIKEESTSRLASTAPSEYRVAWIVFWLPIHKRYATQIVKCLCVPGGCIVVQLWYVASRMLDKFDFLHM